MSVGAPVAALVGGLLGAVALPFALSHDRQAQGEFEYVAPSSFEPAQGELLRKLTVGHIEPTEADDSRILPPPDEVNRPHGRKAWHAQSTSGYAPRIVQLHSERPYRVDDATLERIASNMTEHQRSRGLSYTTQERRVLVRADGARVGLIRWDVDSEPSSPQPKILGRSAVQLIFPDNHGLSILTAHFARSDAESLEAGLLESVETTRGVAFQAAPLSLGLRLGAALTLGALGWVLASWAQKRKKA